MEKFIPYEKLSKKKQRELDRQKRNTWGELNPVTRKPENPKAYNRRKARSWKEPDPVPFLLSKLNGIQNLKNFFFVVHHPGSTVHRQRIVPIFRIKSNE